MNLNNWYKLNSEEKEKMITPYIEEIKQKIIKSKSLTISMDLEWDNDGYIESIASETIHIGVRY